MALSEIVGYRGVEIKMGKIRNWTKKTDRRWHNDNTGYGIAIYENEAGNYEVILEDANRDKIRRIGRGRTKETVDTLAKDWMRSNPMSKLKNPEGEYSVKTASKYDEKPYEIVVEYIDNGQPRTTTLDAYEWYWVAGENILVVKTEGGTKKLGQASVRPPNKAIRKVVEKNIEMYENTERLIAEVINDLGIYEAPEIIDQIKIELNQLR